jgi:hypothetical protein
LSWLWFGVSRAVGGANALPPTPPLTPHPLRRRSQRGQPATAARALRGLPAPPTVSAFGTWTRPLVAPSSFPRGRPTACRGPSSPVCGRAVCTAHMAPFARFLVKPRQQLWGKTAREPRQGRVDGRDDVGTPFRSRGLGLWALAYTLRAVSPCALCGAESSRGLCSTADGEMVVLGVHVFSGQPPWCLPGSAVARQQHCVQRQHGVRAQWHQRQQRRGLCCGQMQLCGWWIGQPGYVCCVWKGCRV